MHAYRNAHKPCCPRLRSMIAGRFRSACTVQVLPISPQGTAFGSPGACTPLKAPAPSETQTETETETEAEAEAETRGDPVLLPEEGRGDRPFAVFPRARRLSAHTCRRAGRAVRIPGLACLPTALSPESRLSEKRMKKTGKSRPPAAKRLTLGGFHAIISATVPGGDGAANREEKGCRFR